MTDSIKTTSLLVSSAGIEDGQLHVSWSASDGRGVVVMIATDGTAAYSICHGPNDTYSANIHEFRIASGWPKKLMQEIGRE